MAKKPVPPIRDRKTLSVYPEPALYKKLKDAAERENRSLAAMAGEILERYLNGICVTLDPALRTILEQEASDRQWSAEQTISYILSKYYQAQASAAATAPAATSP